MRFFTVLFVAFFASFISTPGLGQTVDSTLDPGSSFCAGDATTVSFTSSGTFNVGNVFTAELSDASGSFASPVNIGTLPLDGTVTSGDISATIPTNALSGSGYKVRVTSSDPSYIGPENATSFTVQATPVVNTVSNAMYCNTDAGSAITFGTSTTGGPATYNWTSTADVGFGVSGSGDIAAFTATNAGSSPVTATVSVTATINGCTGPAETFDITVNPTPAVNAVSNATYCNTDAGSAITFGTATTGGPATYNWTSTADIGFGVSGSGDIAVFTATNAGSSPVTATVSVTATINGCTGPAETFDITVNPTPAVNAVSNAAYCNTDAGSAITFGTSTTGGTATYNWTSTADVGFGVSGSGDIAAFTATNAGSSPVTATVSVTATINGCTGPAETFDITVNPTPAVNAVSNATYCNTDAGSAITFGTSTTGGTATYNWTSTADVGFGVSGSGDIAAFTATNASSSPVTATVSVTATINGCTGPAETFDITVNPTPAVNAVSNAAYCNTDAGSAITFGTATTGGPATYNWTSTADVGFGVSGSGDIAAFTATNAGSSPVTATVSVTATINGCTGPAETFDITVNPTPAVNAISNAAYCNTDAGSAITFGTATTGGPATYNWTSTVDVGFGVSGSGDIAAYTATNASSSPVTATVSVTATINGCTGPAETFDITVNPTPAVNAVSNAAYCNTDAGSAITFGTATTGGPATYNWTSTADVGFGVSGSGDIAAFTATNAGSSPVTATVSVTATINGCTGLAETFDITVNPTPAVNAISNAAYCNTDAGSAITFGTATTGGPATYNWTSTADVGFGVSGSGDIAAFTATNAGSSPVTATVSVTATINGCTGLAETFDITVNPTPAVNAISNAAYCNTDAGSAITFGTATTGGPATYNWTSTADVGFGVSGSGDIAAFTATNAGSSPVTATVSVTATINGCTGLAETFDITVNPTPAVNAVSNATYCNTDPGSAITFGTATTGGPATYNWTSTADIGFGVSGSGDIAAFTATNAGSSPVTATVSVTATINGCTGPAETFDITVNPTPAVNAISNAAYCNTEAGSAITFGTATTGGPATYNWTSTADVGFGVSGSGDIAAFTATNAGSSPVTATVSVTATINGCTGPAETFDITVNPLPTLTVSDLTVCSDAEGGNAAAGLDLNPQVSTDGSTVTYEVGGSPITAGNYNATNGDVVSVTSTSAAGCAITKTFTITVNPTPTLTVSDLTVCSDAEGGNAAAGLDLNPQVSTDGSTVTYEVGGSPITAGNYNATNGDVVSVTSTSASGCAITKTFTITVNPTPTLTVSDLTVCSDAEGGNAAAGLDLTPQVSTDGSTVTYEVGGSPITAGNYNATNGDVVSVTSTSAAGCAITKTFTITVNPTPTLTVSDLTVCSDAEGGNAAAGLDLNPQVSTDGSTVTYEVGGSPITAGNYNATNGDVVSVTSTSAAGCAITKTFTITVNPTPTLTVSDLTVCSDAEGGNAAAGLDLNPQVSTDGSTVTYEVGGSPITAGNYNATNGDVVSVTSTSAAGCAITKTFTITVNPTPTLTVSDLTVCSDAEGGNAAAGLDLNPQVSTDGSTVTYEVGGSPITAGNYNATNGDVVSVTSNSAAGCAITKTFTITVNPTPTLTVSDLTVCSDAEGGNAAAGLDLNPQVSTDGSTVTYEVGGSPITAGNYNATNGDVVSVTSTSASGCAITKTFTITVNPTPTLTVSDLTVCSDAEGGSTAIVNLENQVSLVGGTASYRIGATPISDPQNYNATNSDVITVTGTSGPGCVISKTFVITINPTPTLSTTDLVVCSDSFGGNTVSGINLNDQISLSGGTPIFKIGPVTISNPTNYLATNGEVITVVGTSAQGCEISKDFNVTVDPLPLDRSLSSTPTFICDGETVSVTIASPQAGVEYVLQDGNNNPISSVESGASPIETSSISTSFVNPIKVFATNTTTGCSVYLTQEFPVTFKTPSTPVANIIRSDDNICPGTPVTLEATGGTVGTGSVIRWYTAPNGGSAVVHEGAGPFQVTPSATTTYYARREGDCNITTDNSSLVNVQVEPTPISQVIESRANECPGESVTLTASGGIDGTNSTIRWYTTPTPSGPGEAIFTGAGPYLVTPPPTQTTTYYVRRESSCLDTPMFSFVLNVNTLSSLDGITADFTSVCPNDPVQLTADNPVIGTGASLNWFTAPGGNGTNLGSTNSITVNPASTATYYLRIAGPCNTVEESITINVKSLSSIGSISTSGNNICPGESVSLTANSVVLGTGASGVAWYDASGGPTGGGNLLGSSNPLNISYSTTTTVYAWIEGDCNSDEESFQVVVETLPNLSITDPTPVCSPATVDIDDPSVYTDLAGTSGNVTFWRNAGATVPLDNPDAVSDLGVNTFYIKKTTSVGGCFDIQPVVVTINEAAEVNAGPDLNICEAELTVQMNGSFGGSTSNITWTTSGDGTFDNASNVNAVYTFGANDKSTTTVTLTITSDDPGDPGAPCFAVSDDVVVVLGSSATAFAGDDFTICEDENAQLNGVVGGGVSTGTWSTAGDGTFSSTTDLNATYFPGTNDISSGSVVLTLESDDPAGDCTTASSNVTVTIDPNGSIDAGSNQSICEDGSATLSAVLSGQATQMVWTTSGDGGFDIDTSPNAVYTPGSGDKSSGQVTLTATITDPGLSGSQCVTFSDAVTISINLLPSITINPVSALCADAGSVMLSASPSGGAFSGPGVSGDNFDPSISGAGMQTITYTYTDGNSCTNSATIDIEVLALPSDKAITPTTATFICENETVTLSITGSDAGTNYVIHDNVGNAISNVEAGGGDISITTNALANTLLTPIKVLATNATTSCDTYLSQTVDITFKTPSTPVTNFIKSNDNTCPGTEVTLTAEGGTAGTGSQIVWYSSPNGVGQLQTGTSLTVSPTVSTTYYVRREGDCNTTIDNSVTINVFVESTELTVINKSDDNICPGTSVQLSASGGVDGTNALVKWYDGPNGTGTNLHIGLGPFPVTPDVTTTYYVRREGTCNTTADVEITVNVKVESTTPDNVTSNIDNVCPATDVEITATGGINGTGAGVFWYDNSSGTGSPIFTGEGPHTVSPTVTTTYYVRREGDCNITDLADVTVTIKSESSISSLTTSSNNVCPGTQISITAEDVVLGTNASLEWYDGPNGTGNFLGIANPLILTYNTSTTVYAYITGDCGIVQESVDIIVKDVSDMGDLSANVNNTCPGDPVELTVAGLVLGTNATFSWYTSPDGVGPIGSNSTITVNPTATTVYYARVTGDCNTIEKSIQVDVKTQSVLGDLLTNGDNVCPGQTVNLNISELTVGTGATFSWYTSPGGVGPISSNISIPVTPLVTTTYYARVAGDCNTIEKSITISVKTESEIGDLTRNVNNVCPNDPVSITANDVVLGTNATFAWFRQPGGIDPISTNTSIVVNPTETTTYYARVGGDCNFIEKTISIDVKTESTLGDLVKTADLQCPGGTVQLTANDIVLGTNATFNWYTGPNGTGSNLGSTAQVSVNPSVTSTYYARIDGDCNNIEKSIVVNVVVAPDLEINNPPATVCTPGTVDITNSWIDNNSSVGTISYWRDAAATSQPLVDPDQVSTSGTYYIKKTTDQSSCIDIVSVDVTVNIAPTVNAGQDLSVCEGFNEVELNGTTGGSTTTILWTTSGNGTFKSGNNNIEDPIYVLGSQDITNGSVTLTITSTDTDGGGPCQVATDQMVITIGNSVGVSAGEDFAICQDGVAQLDGIFSGGATSATWSIVSGSGSFEDSGDPKTRYTPSANDIANGQVTLRLTTNDPPGPCTFASDDITIRINQKATVNAGPDKEICEDGIVSINGTVGGGSSTGFWSTNGDGNFADFQNLVTTYDPGPNDILNGSVVLTLTANDPDGSEPCTQVSDNMTLTINLKPLFDVTDPDPFCNSESVDLNNFFTDTRNLTGTVTFWKDVNRTIPLDNSEAVNESGEYFVYKETLFGCSEITSINVTAYLTPDVQVTNPDPVCQPGVIDISGLFVDANVLPGVFTFFKDGEEIQESELTSIASSGEYTIRKTTPDGCSDEAVITVVVNTTPELIVTNPNPICKPGTIDLNDYVEDAAGTNGTYIFSLSNDFSTEISDPTSIANTGVYYVRKTTNEGCIDESSINVIIESVPDLEITNPPAVCAPLTVDITTTFNDLAGTQGQVTYFSDQELTTEVEDPENISVEGFYYIRKTTLVSGCTDVEAVEVKIDISPILIVENPDPVCEGTPVDLTTVFIDSNQTTGSVSYFADAALTEPVSNPASVTSSGVYFIRKETLFGKCPDVATVDVVIKPAPAPPIITFDTDNQILTTDSEGEIQWYDSEGLIEGANSSSYEPETTGIYYATATLNGCTSEFSDELSLSVTGLAEAFGDLEISLYPNPVEHTLYLKFSMEISPDEISVRDLNGREVIGLRNPSPSNQWSFDVTEWGTGAYLIMIRKGDHYEIRKVMVN